MPDPGIINCFKENSVGQVFLLMFLIPQIFLMTSLRMWGKGNAAHSFHENSLILSLASDNLEN